MTIVSFSREHRFLSNFFDSEVEFEGKKYATVEHAYQAAKTLDEGLREEIRLAPTPGKAKRLGQQVDLRKDWESVKISVMRDLLEKKFSPGSQLAKKLLETGHQELVERNHWGDCFWGVCQGKGENHLGRLLTEIRTNLREDRKAIYFLGKDFES